jgi:DNA-binding NarL/FixJ family response regulator
LLAVLAERLVVSPRTVEGHLCRTFLKLDVTDREDLATLMRLGG